MAAISMLHGQRLRDLFSPIYCVLRTNNKYVYKPLAQTGPTYRSDRLDKPQLSANEQRARIAITHMHAEVFGLIDVELPFGRPLKIQHSFDPRVTIEGVQSDEIIYVFGMTTPARGLFKLLARRARKKKSNG